MRNNSFAVPFIILVLTFLATAGAADALPVTITDARGVDVRVADASRIVSLGAAVTETVAALGAADRLAGVDASSTYPPQELAGVARTGYVREVSAEGILSLGPTLVVGSVDVGPPEVIEQLESAGVAVVIVPEDDTLEGVVRRIRFIAEVIGAGSEAEELVAGVRADAEAAEELVASVPADQRLSVMFVYARGAGTLMVSGENTSAHAMIGLAGGRNAIAGFSGYRPLTAEAAIAAAPDVLLFMTSGLASLGGVEGLAAIPGLVQTPAYQNGRIVAFDDAYLLGFGPRTGAAVHDLAAALYGGAGRSQ